MTKRQQSEIQNMLTSEQNSEFKAVLRARFAELRVEIREELLAHEQQHFIDLAGRVHDSADEAVADLLTDIDHAAIGRHVAEIRDIDASLMRMARGLYGVCTDCEADIVLERLRAYPTARRCHDCQVRFERGSGSRRVSSI